MLKKFIIVLNIFLSSPLLYAETCPSIDQIQKNNLHGWQAFNRDGGVNVSNGLNQASSFALGYFAPEATEGEAQCYYEDNSGNDYVNVYLAKQTLYPDTKTGNWVHYPDGRLECRSHNTTECVFIKK